MKPEDPLYPIFLKLIKKHTKPNRFNKPLTGIGNSLAVGGPGQCKTSGNKKEIELRFDKGSKICLLYDAGRMDLPYFMFPSNDDFWKKPKLDGKFIVGRRPYPILLAYPVSKNIPEKLPKNAIPFTIAVDSLTEDDLVALVGGASRDTIKGIFYYMQNYVNEDTTAEDYVNMMGAALKKVEDTDGIKPSHFGAKKLKGDFFQPLLNEGLLSSAKASTVINIREMIKDNKTMFCLVIKHTPKYLWGFLVHYFMNHISIELGGFGTERQLKQHVTIGLTEIADLLSQDEDIGSAAYSITTMIEKILKQSRTFAISLLMDTQLPQELPVVKETLQRIYVYNSSIPSIQKAMEIIGISQRSGEITNDDLMVIPRLSRGWYYLFDRDEGVSIHKLVWCRSRSWKEGENFYDVYDKVFGKGAYYSIKDKLKELEIERKKSKEAWDLRKQLMKTRIENAILDKKAASIALVEEKIRERESNRLNARKKLKTGEDDDLDINEINIITNNEKPKIKKTKSKIESEKDDLILDEDAGEPIKKVITVSEETEISAISTQTPINIVSNSEIPKKRPSYATLKKIMKTI